MLGAALETPQLATAPALFRGEYFDQLGTALLKLERVREALDAFQVALVADPTRPGPRAVLDGLKGALAQTGVAAGG